MLVFLSNFILILAEGGGAGQSEGGFLAWWEKNADPYLNYPGFELWRFINLTIFVIVMVYILKKPLTEAFKARRETIREDLIRAEEQRQAALAKLTEAEANLARLDIDKEEVIEHARAEAGAESERIARETEADEKRLRLQAENEIERKAQQVRSSLRRFSAEESIRLAEEKIRQVMNDQKDADLVRANIRSIGGMN